MIEFLPCDVESEWIEYDKKGNVIGRHKEKGFGTLVGYYAQVYVTATGKTYKWNEEKKKYEEQIRVLK